MAMNIQPPPTRIAVTGEAIGVEDLAHEGFTDEQIARLSALRADYPFIEFAGDIAEWRRLGFLRWRCQHGDLRRES